MTIRSFALLSGVLLLACPRRERITAPTSGDGVGPEIVITDPAQDVTMIAGTALFIRGTAFDEEGVDSIFFDQLEDSVGILSQSAGGMARAAFAIPVDLIGAAGDTVIITVYAANLDHVRGDPVVRRIRLR